MALYLFENLDLQNSVQRTAIIDLITDNISINCEENNIADFNILIRDIIMSVMSLYYHEYKDQLSIDILTQESSNIVNLILFILLSSHLFQISDSKFIFEQASWNKKCKEGLKKIFKNMLESSDICDNFFIYDVDIYCNIIYSTFMSIINKDNFFQSVTHFDKNKDKIDFRALTEDQKNIIRSQILYYYKEHCNENVTMQTIADIFRVEVRNVSRVIQYYNNNPCANSIDFKDNKKGPAESFFNVISAAIFVQLLDVIMNKIPSDFNINYTTWSGNAIVDYLLQIHQLDVPREYVYYFLRRFEINSKFGRRVNPKRDIDEMLKFIKVKYREICEEAKKRGEVVLFGDETSVQQGYDVKGFAPKGERAVVMHNTSAKHTGASLFTVMGPDGFVKMFLIDGTFDAIIFKQCLKILNEEFPDKKFVLILDNSRVHHAKLIQEWMTKLEKKDKNFIRLEWLPAYCPELNPVEYLNNDFKGYLKKFAATTKEDVINKAKEYIEKYIIDDETKTKERISSFFMAKYCLFTYQIYNHVFHDIEINENYSNC